MLRMRHGERSYSVAAPARLLLVIAVVSALTALAGCSRDNRISLSEFVEQQGRDGAPTPVFHPPATQPAEAAEVMGPYRVGEGDVLGVTLTGVDQTGTVAPISARVNRDGNVDLPIVGKVQVAGDPLQDVEQTIQNAYVPSVYRQASVHVQLVQPETVNVLVTGAVTAPGLVQLPRSQRNLLYAVAAAGGISSLASGEVTLRRLNAPGETVEINMLDPEQLQYALTMQPLRNGDIVIAKAATPNAIFISGLVMAPHVQINPPGTEMTVLQALASAGGLRMDLLSVNEATLIRRMPNGEDVHVKLDINKIQKGDDPNITLAAGDILWVPHTVETRIEDWANRNLFFRAGFSAVGTYNATAIEYMNSNAREQAVGVTGNLENTFDPFGFLIRQQQLNQLPAPQ